jgi:urease accessory protein
MHPLTGLDHIIAMVAAGLWGVQLGAPAIWVLPVTFPMVGLSRGMLKKGGAALLALSL